MNRISAVFSPADAKKTGVPNVPQSPQKSRKKTSAPPVTVTNQSLERQESRGPINLDSPVQNLPSPSLDVGVAALKASHGSAKSSVSSIKRVKPPSADLVPTSSHVSGEAASTTAMRAPSPNVSRQASTEEMTETLKDDTPSPQIPSTIEATTSQDNSVVESPIAAPREVSQPTVSNPSENEPIVSAEVVEKNKQEPVEKAEAGAETEHSVSKEEQHIHEQTQTSADLEPQTKEDVTGPIAEAVQPVHEEAEGPSVPTAPQPEPELEVSRDSIVDTSAISETVGDEERPSSHAEAKADLSTALPEEDSPDDAQSKPEVSTVTTPAVNSQTATDPQVSTGESEHSGKQEASEQNLETPLAAESASEERAEPAVPPIAVPSASVEPEADNSDKTPTTPQHLEVPESSKPRKSPSAASFASQSSKASSNTSSTPEKKSKKLMAGAKRMMSSPFRKGKKTSQDFSTASSTGSIPDAQASIPDQPEGLSDTKGQIEGDSSANGMERVQEPVQEEPFAAVTLKPAEDETQTSNVAESAEGRKTPTQASPEPSIEPGEPAKIQETGSKSNDQAADPVSTVVEPDSMSAEEGPSHSVESAALKTNQNDESLPSDEPPLSASSEQTSVPILAASSQPADVADESTEPSTKVTAEPFSESMPDSVSQVSLSGGTTSQQAGKSIFLYCRPPAHNSCSASARF